MKKYCCNRFLMPPAKAVVDGVRPFLERDFQNLSYLEEEALWEKAKTDSLDFIKNYFKIKMHDHFSRNSSLYESIATLFSSVASEKKGHCIISSLSETCIHDMCKDFFHSHSVVTPDYDGRISMQEIQEKIQEDTALIFLPFADSLTGVVQPIYEVQRFCLTKKIFFALDCSLCFGSVSLENLVPSDYVLFGLEPHLSLRGISGLQVREGVPFYPFLRHEEEDLFSIEMAEALRESVVQKSYFTTEGARLRQIFEKGIVEGFPHAFVLFKEEERLPSQSTIVFPGVHQEALYQLLLSMNFAATLEKGSNSLREDLLSMGLSPSVAHSALSFSLMPYLQEEDIQEMIRRIVYAAKERRKLTEGLIP